LTKTRSGYGQTVEGMRGTLPVSHRFRTSAVSSCLRNSYWFTARAALAMFAIVVQIMLPFVLAADIAASANATPICHVPNGEDQKDHQQNPANSCPICAALAATVVATPPALPPIPLLRLGVARKALALYEDGADISYPTPYRSRAPPIA
jgi:hypothetical protein